MSSLFGRSWWGLALRGLLSILFGIALLVWPGPSALALVALIGAFLLVDGVFALINAFRVRAGHRRWWALLIEGLVGIAAGVMTLVWPGAATIAILYLIAAWAVITGVLEIISAIRFADELDNEWMLALGGILSVIFGILIAVWPAAGLTAVLWLIAAYSIVFGILMLIAGLRARKYADQTATFRAA